MIANPDTCPDRCPDRLVTPGQVSGRRVFLEPLSGHPKLNEISGIAQVSGCPPLELPDTRTASDPHTCFAHNVWPAEGT
jgi:hypothetical protein